MGIGEIIGLIKSLGGGGGGSVPKPLTYDYMPEGYPKKSGWSIEWDGNTEGLVSVADMFFKVSDLPPTDDELIGSTVELSNGNKFEITSDRVDVTYEGIAFAELVVFVKKDNATLGELTFPQKGAYFAWTPDFYTTKTSKQAITPMAEEFMPLPKPLTYDYMPEGYPKKDGEKATPMSEEFIPSIPMDKLPDIPVIEFSTIIMDTILDSIQPSYIANNLNYTELLNIISKGYFAIKDPVSFYWPISWDVDSTGNLTIDIICTTTTDNNMLVYASLNCNKENNRFYRNNYRTSPQQEDK